MTDRFRVLVGDARELAGTVENVQTIVTSPPYWHLRDYRLDGQIGMEPTPDAFVEAMVLTFREARRALRKDGTMWLNLGDSYSGSRRGSTGKSSKLSTPERHDLVPNIESKSTLCGLPRKSLIGIPWRVALALQADGWILRSEVIWSKPSPVPGSMQDRPTSSHEHVFLFSRRATYFYDANAVRQPLRPNTLRLQAQGPARSATVPDPRAASYGLGRWGKKRAAKLDENGEPMGANLRDVWSFGGGRYKGDHYSTFPVELLRRCILASSRPNDVVLDPFVGTGTVLEAACVLGRRGVGIDLDPRTPARVAKRLRGLQVEISETSTPKADFAP